MVRFNNNFGSFFDDFFYPLRGTAKEDETWNWQPAVDIYENDDAIVVKAELPGVDKKDISVDLNGDTLTLKGERTSEKEAKEDQYYRKERVYGSFERHFKLPENVNPEKINADFKDGVLKVEIAKPEAIKPKQITVH
jgi:HSP20 family protein